MNKKRNIIKKYAKFIFFLQSSRQRKGKRNWNRGWFIYFVSAHFNKQFYNLNEIELSQLYMFLRNKFLTTYCCKKHNVFREEKESERWKDLKKIAELLPLKGKKCVKCGATENLTRDHIIPYAKGGKAELSNLQILCEDCHDEKTLKDIGC